MDLIEMLDDILEEESLRRRRSIRTRPNFLLVLEDEEFRRRFRLSKEAVRLVHTLIQERIATVTNRNFAIGTMEQLTLTLRYLATGSYLITAGDFSGVSESSACRIVRRVCEAIASLGPLYIKFPLDLDAVKQGFYTIARFPRIIGAIDCTHVIIKSPGGDNAETYRNRKSAFSLNVQMVCDSNLRILDVVARWPGSCHDQTIFNNSSLKRRLEIGEFRDSFILGDGGYETNHYMLTPLANSCTQAENLYNESQIRTRNAVERMFGVLKNRFPVLRRTITLHLVRVQAIIVSCAVLHNIAIDLKEESFTIDPIDEPDDNDSDRQHHEGFDSNDARRQIIDEYFSALLNI